MSPHLYSIADPRLSFRRYHQHLFPFLCGVFRSPRLISPLLLWPFGWSYIFRQDQTYNRTLACASSTSIFTHSTIRTLADVFHDLALSPLALLPLPVALSYPIDIPCPSLSNCPQSYLSSARLGERSSVSKTHAMRAAFFPIGPSLEPFSNPVACSCPTYPAQTL
jgi:hypothetical protein